MAETPGIPIQRVDSRVNLPPRFPQPEQEVTKNSLFELISAFGNHEAKALTLIAMGSGNMFTQGDLGRTVIDHQERQRRWEIDRIVPFSYCRDSLAPIGLVTKEVLDPDLSTYGYQITEYGKTTGVDLAGLLLKWSYDHSDVSLYQMFGSTASSGSKLKTGEEINRSPQTRYKIFFELATNPDHKIRQIDIREALGMDASAIQAHFRSLGETGIITYEHTPPGKPYISYRLKEIHPEKEPTPYRGRPIITANVYSFLKDNQGSEFLSAEDFTRQFLEKFPNYEGKYVRHDITQVCTDLEKQGYTEREKFGAEFRSEITLTDEQKEAIVSLIEILDRFQTGDQEMIREGREFAQRVMADPNLFSTLMLKAKEASPSANKRSREQSDSDILSIIANFPGTTVSDLQTEYDKGAGRHMNIDTISTYVRNLTKQGLLISEDSKSGKVYRINPQPE